jgi:hypothetical protein
MRSCESCGAPDDQGCRPGCSEISTTVAAAQHQVMPTPNGNPAIQDLVVADIEARKQVGLERYGTYLQAHNGRDALLDAYQEALDLAIYLRQALAERDGK